MTIVTAPVRDAGFHAIQRRLAALLPDAATIAGGGTLELTGAWSSERPRLDPPRVIEGDAIRAHPVLGELTARFAAFLDGTQASRIAQYDGGVPIVHGTVAAVVRARRDQRLVTWRAPLLHRAIYAPLALLSTRARAALDDVDADVIDTGAQRELDSIHPIALQEAAMQAVQRHREAVERELAEAWCTSAEGELFVDGGISESETVATASCVAGVVKSHRQLHVHGDDLPLILGLRARERSSVVRITSRRRTPVASWYLRLRDPAGRDPLWGLIRVEVADVSEASAAAIADRADSVSRWVLAEALPLAVPDGRWDRMTYGIRDCEEFLRAIQ